MQDTDSDNKPFCFSLRLSSLVFFSSFLIFWTFLTVSQAHAGDLFDLTSGDPRIQGQKEEEAKALKVNLGISKKEFLKQVGRPDSLNDSEDGKFEILNYETTLPYSAFLGAVVEKSSGGVVAISHGEDWKEQRVLPGTKVPIQTNYNSKREYTDES